MTRKVMREVHRFAFWRFSQQRRYTANRRSNHSYTRAPAPVGTHKMAPIASPGAKAGQSTGGSLLPTRRPRGLSR